MRALGTQFNVYQHSGTTTVSVVEGTVQVVGTALEMPPPPAPPAAGASTVLSKGETARIAAGQLSKQVVSDTSDITAWRERRLVFKNTPLAQVAEEFNRYNTVQIKTEGDIGLSKRLTGSFSSDHPQSLILYLQRMPTLNVTLSGDTYVVRALEP